MKFLVLLGALCRAQYTLAEQIDVDVCKADVTNTFINNIDLAVDPNPIEVKAGKTISLHFGVDILKEVAVGATVELKLKKGLLPIPCIDVGLPVPIGSCKYDIQQLLDFLAESQDFDCDKYLPGNGCSLPMLPGHYGGEFHGDDAIVIELPQDLVIPDILKPFLDGTIKIHLSMAADGAEIVCIDTEIGVTC
jgi:hypothetical protein